MQPIRKNPLLKLKLLSLAGLTCLACLIWFALVPTLALMANRPAAGSVSGSGVGARSLSHITPAPTSTQTTSNLPRSQ